MPIPGAFLLPLRSGSRNQPSFCVFLLFFCSFLTLSANIISSCTPTTTRTTTTTKCLLGREGQGDTRANEERKGTQTDQWIKAKIDTNRTWYISSDQHLLWRRIIWDTAEFAVTLTTDFFATRIVFFCSCTRQVVVLWVSVYSGAGIWFLISKEETTDSTLAALTSTNQGKPHSTTVSTLIKVRTTRVWDICRKKWRAFRPPDLASLELEQPDTNLIW